MLHDRRAELYKIPGKENEADLGTKVLTGAAIWEMLYRMGFQLRQGKSELALEAVP